MVWPSSSNLRARACERPGHELRYCSRAKRGRERGTWRAPSPPPPLPGPPRGQLRGASDELLGSELFGRRKGAFTGAVADREGLLLGARGQSLLLDEIGEVSLRMQRMVLRALERSRPTVKHLGADEKIPLREIRFLFATERDIRADAQEGRFREDLLRRIEIVRILPPFASARISFPPSWGGPWRISKSLRVSPPPR